MTHPFRHDLEAALARIEQLESTLADTQQPPSLSEQMWRKVRTPLMVGTVLGSLLAGVGFSTLLVAHDEDDEPEPDFGLAADIAEAHTAIRTQIVTVSPRGISALQVGDIASGKAPDLNEACGGVNEPVGVTLDLDIVADGSVARAQARGPDVLARCTERAARTWTFPRSDGATHASVPLYFRPNLATGTRTVHLPAAARDPGAKQPPETGTLAVSCMPACDTVLEDGVPLGRSPILAHPSTVGRHVIELISGTRRHTVYTHVYARQLADIREDLTETPDPDTLAPL